MTDLHTPAEPVPTRAIRGHRLVRANEAWESLLRAQAMLARRFAGQQAFDDVSMSEYDVLYTLSTMTKRDTTGRGVRIADLGEQVLLSQPGLSRLLERLVARGWVQRHPDPHDRRAVRIHLTELGTAVQRRVGTEHAQAVAQTMTERLTDDELDELRRLTERLIQPGARADAAG